MNDFPNIAYKRESKIHEFTVYGRGQQFTGYGLTMMGAIEHAKAQKAAATPNRLAASLSTLVREAKVA